MFREHSHWITLSIISMICNYLINLFLGRCQPCSQRIQNLFSAEFERRSIIIGWCFEIHTMSTVVTINVYSLESTLSFSILDLSEPSILPWIFGSIHENNIRPNHIITTIKVVVVVDSWFSSNIFSTKNSLAEWSPILRSN